MDGQKRMIPRWSLVAGAGVAAVLVAPGACLGQQASKNSKAVRASASSIPSPIPPSRSDPAVERTHFHERYASPQQQAPPAPSKPQPSYEPPAAAPPAPYAPAYPNYAPPQAGFAPAQPGFAPQYMMVPVMAPPAAAPAGNFFLPGAAPMMAPAAPGYAMPMAPMAPAFAMPMAPAPPQPAAFGTGMALGGSSVSVPTSSSTSSVEIRGPGIFSAALARVGERMVQLGRTRVRTVQETVLQTPQSQPMGGTATIATAGLTPIQPPAAPPQPPEQYAPPQQEAPPEVPVPSPQGAHAHPKSKIHHLFGHE